MNNNSLGRLGGLCAILLGISYVLIGILFLLMPADQRPGSDAIAFYGYVAENPTLIRAYYLVFALGAVVGLGAVPAISEKVRPLHEGWMRWMTSLAYLGFAVTAIDNFGFWATQAYRAMAFVKADDPIRRALDINAPGLDTQAFLGFGGVGAWVLVISLLALRGNTWPRLLSYLGIAVASSYWLVVAGNLFDTGLFLSIAAALGGVLLGPVWYIWVGLILRREPLASTRPSAPELQTAGTD